MKNGIPSKDYYTLLEWKDENMSEWLYLSSHVYGVERMCDMTTEQLIHLKNRIKN
jgi:hypothetical protein